MLYNIWDFFVFERKLVLIQQGCIKSIKNDSKDIYNVTKDYISNKCCSFELSIHQRILKKKILYTNILYNCTQ